MAQKRSLLTVSLQSVRSYTDGVSSHRMLNRAESERPDSHSGEPDLTHLDATELQIQLRLAIERAEHLRKQAEDAEKQSAKLRELLTRLGDKDGQK